jgi:hypothetical protein
MSLTLALLAVSDSGVLDAGSSQPKEVFVVTEDDATSSQTKGELGLPVADGQKTTLRPVDPETQSSGTVPGL